MSIRWKHTVLVLTPCLSVNTVLSGRIGNSGFNGFYTQKSICLPDYTCMHYSRADTSLRNILGEIYISYKQKTKKLTKLTPLMTRLIPLVFTVTAGCHLTRATIGCFSSSLHRKP